MVYHDDHGVAGDAVAHLHRLVEAPPLKRLLAASGSEVAFIVSDYFYDTVIRRHPTLMDPAGFERVTIDTSHATAVGWVELTRSASPAVRILPFNQTA
jgi:hypothetical protein